MRKIKSREIIFSVFVFVLFLGGCCSERYTSTNVGVGVSGMLDELGELDLSKDLDASLLPDMVSQCYKEGLQKKKEKAELQQYVVKALSQKIREISTVDLNGDGTADPILVIPEGDSEHITFSIRVPDPKEVAEYPSLSDAAAWQDIAEKKAVELVAVTAVPQVEREKVKGMQLEARPSSAFYSSSQYYRNSFTSDLLTYMLVRDLFFRPYWFGPSYYGWYGGAYRPYGVGSVHNARSTTIRKYSSGNSSFSRMRTSSGNLPTRSAGSQLASQKSFSSAVNVRKNLKSGGFGRSSSGSTTRKGFGRSGSRSKTSAASKRSSRGWFSGSSSRGGFRWGK